MHLSVREYGVEKEHGHGDENDDVGSSSSSDISSDDSNRSNSSSSSRSNSSSCSVGVEVRMWLLGSGKYLIVSNLDIPPVVVSARPLSASGLGLGPETASGLGLEPGQHQGQGYRVEATLMSHDALPREQMMNPTGQGLGSASEPGLDRPQKIWTSTYATIVNTKIILPSDHVKGRGRDDDDDGVTETSSPSNIRRENHHHQHHRQSSAVGRDTSDQGVELILRFPFVD